MTVYEVRNGNETVSVEALNGNEAICIAAEELAVYDGTFELYNCSGEVFLGAYTWEEANFSE